MTTLTSFKNNEELKDLLVEETIKHRKADQIIQGTYGTEEDGVWKGCAVGCAIHSLNLRLGTKHSTEDHKVYETELGIPEWLARLEDRLFEGMPKDDAKKWPEQFIKAIPVGVDLEPVKWKFCSYLMAENIKRVKSLDIDKELKNKVIKATEGVKAVHDKAIKTGVWDKSAAESAESAAWSAALSAACRAASAARSAAWSAAWSAESAARSAAWSAAESADYLKHSMKLLSILKNTN